MIRGRWPVQRGVGFTFLSSAVSVVSERVLDFMCVCVCPATWMNNLEVFQKSRTAGSD